MKETIIKLADEIVGYLEKDAKELGIPTADLIRFIIGSYVQGEKRGLASMPHSAIMIDLKSMFSGLGDLPREFLKQKARDGALSCKDCTMKLTEEDIDNDKCGSCGIPLKDALKGGPHD